MSNYHAPHVPDLDSLSPKVPQKQNSSRHTYYGNFHIIPKGPPVVVIPKKDETLMKKTLETHKIEPIKLKNCHRCLEYQRVVKGKDLEIERLEGII